MIHPGGKLRPGRVVTIADGFKVEIVDTTPRRTRIVKLHTSGDPLAAIEAHGHREQRNAAAGVIIGAVEHLAVADTQVIVMSHHDRAAGGSAPGNARDDVHAGDAVRSARPPPPPAPPDLLCAEPMHAASTPGRGASNGSLLGGGSAVPGAISPPSSLTPAERAAIEQELAPLLQRAKSLLHSRSGAVVLAAAALLLRLGPPSQRTLIVRPLCRLTRSPHPEVAHCALQAVAQLARVQPELFTSTLTFFFTSAQDPAYISDARIRILSALTTAQTVGPISTELTAYLRSPSAPLACSAARGIAECATRLPAVAESCLGSLVSLLTCGDEPTVAVVIESMRRVLQSPKLPQQPRIVATLALQLPRIRSPAARASLVWTVGQHLDLLPEIAPETLRQLLLSFADEASPVKLQTLTLAAKCAASELPRSGAMLRYALDLARFDLDCDVRARARLLAALSLDGDTFQKRERLQSVGTPSKPAAACAPSSSLIDDDGVPPASATPTPSSSSGAALPDEASAAASAAAPNPLLAHMARLFLTPTAPASVEVEEAPIADFALGSISLLLGKAQVGYRPLPAGLYFVKKVPRA
jgi:hypothetical protein